MNRRLIIIDDEESIRNPITDYFEDMGWDVFPFHSAEDALLFLEKEHVDTAIVDVRLPGMTGIDFIYETIKQKRVINFVIYTGSVDFSLPEDFKSIGVSTNVILKPAESFSVLYNAVISGNTENK